MVHQQNTEEIGRPVGRRSECRGIRVAPWVTSCFVVGSVVVSAGVALAQGSQTPTIPGLVVTSPPTPRAPVAPLRTEPAPTPKATAKPKPKPRPTREASSAPASEGGRGGGTGRRQGIVVLVNDEPITGYEIDQRAAMLTGSANVGERAQGIFKRLAQDPNINNQLRSILEDTIKSNPGKSREQVLAVFEERKKAFVVSIQRRAMDSARASVLPGLRDKALEEIIEEKLKIQEGKRLSVVASDDEVNRAFKEIAERNKITETQFIEQLKIQGVAAETMKARLRASLVWRDVIRRKFGAQVNVSDREVERFMEQSTDDSSASKVELQLHKITLAVPGRIDQAALARRLAEAERLRKRFGGCRTTQELAKGVPDAKFESLANQAAAAVSEPTRSLLLNAKDGEMVPPTLASTGVELYAVCGRKTVKVDEEKRLKAQQELTMREFDVLSRKHLRDLRTDALIERR